MYLGILAAILALFGGVLYRARLNRDVVDDAHLNDDLVRQIEEQGYVEIEEPLDFEEIGEEEARFWDEPDEADEW